MAELQGLPPLPKCFSGVVPCENSTTESWAAQSRHFSRISEKEEDDSESSVDYVDVENGISQSPSDQSVNTPDSSTDISTSATCGCSESEDAVETPFNKLNIALSKLKEEMVGLRQLDVSLLTQLWSLNEAIQEYKVAVQTGYSETNSEYSWGMNSRTSSIGSFDDYDWNADIHFKPEDYNIESSIHGSTSSLLQQINELKERAQSEFL